MHMDRTKGDERLSDATGNDPRRSTGSREKKAQPSPKKAPLERRAPRKSSSDLGKALRSVYDATLGERVPDDFLDLLGKLS